MPQSSRIFAVAVLATASFAALTLSSQARAYADGGRSEDLHEHISCYGPDAVTNVTYTSDGQSVSNLSGVKADAKTQVTFTVGTWCKSVLVGVAAHAPGQTKAISQQSGYFSGGSTNTLSISLPACNFQVDLFAGDPSDLVATGTGGTKDCDVQPIASTSTDHAASPSTIPVLTVAVITPSSQTTATTVPGAATPVAVVPLTPSASTTTTTVANNSAQLAVTGSDSLDLVGIGTCFIVIGLALQSLARRKDHFPSN